MASLPQIGQLEPGRVGSFSQSANDVRQPHLTHSGQPYSFPRRVGARVMNLDHPDEGWAERRQAPGCSGTRLARRVTQDSVALVARALVSRGGPGRLRSTPRPSKSEGRAPLGAPPWRFWAGGRASISGISSRSVQRAPRSQVVMPGGRGPEPSGATVTSRSRGTPLPAPPSGSSPETPLTSEDRTYMAQARGEVNKYARYEYIYFLGQIPLLFQ